MTRTYGSLAFCGDHWSIGGLEPHVTIRFKQLFPHIPKAAGGPYTFKATPAIAADLTWFVSRYTLGASAEDLARLEAGKRQFGDLQDAAERLLSADYQPPLWVGLRPGCELRSHQAAAAELLQLTGGLLVGDDVGEGKTFTAMAACLLPGALPATIVCDPHLQEQWARRFKQFTTLSTYCVTGTQPYVLPPADVRIFRWTQLLGWADVFEMLPCGLVGFDEMQELRTGTAAGKGVAAKRLVANAQFKLGLTATPIYNYGVEIWNVLQYLRPEVLGAQGDFLREWAPSGRVNDPKALGSYLREQHAMVRKRKAGERVSRIVQAVDHDVDVLDAIEDMAQQLAETATTGSFTQRGEATRELDLRVRQQTGIAKAPYVADVVRVLVESGEPIILAGWHRAVYDIWLDKLCDLKPAMYTGSETPAVKAREMARFLNGETDVFILSLRSGRGLDGLQARCRFVVIGELDWSPQVHHQIIGRVDREGSVIDDTDELITALFLVADDGSDPPMMDVLGLKASQSQGIVDPDLGVGVIKADGSHLRALVQRYRERGASGARTEVAA